MGSYGGSEACEVVGVYLLSPLSKFIDKSCIGLYRGDGSAFLKTMPGHTTDGLHKSITKFFQDIGLKVTMDANLQAVDFLDVTGKFRPYQKPVHVFF